MSRYLDLTLDQGATFTQKVNYIDSNKANISLAGYNARAQMRRSQYSANAISITATVSDANNGEITLSLAANATAGLKPGRWYYDVEANTAADASVVRVREGIITVMPGVTGAMAYTVPSGTTTTNIPEGDNLYFTNVRVWANISPRLAALNTSNITEGANLYFSNARARAALGAVGSNLVYYEANGNFQVIVSGGGGAVDSVNGLTGTVVLTTSNIAEGANLYFTDNRVWANVGANIGNLNAWTDSNSSNIGNLNSWVANHNTTTGIAEGTNLYFSNTRARAAVGAVGSNLVYYEANGNFQVIVSENSSANTANVTFQDNFVIGTGEGIVNGLYLAAGSGQVANLQYLRLRGGDDDAHIHFDTGNAEAYDLYLGDDNKYVKLERGFNGNIIIGSSSITGKVWNFDTNGILQVPTTASGWSRISGNNIVIAGDVSDPYAAYLYIPNNADANNDPSGIYNASGNVEIGAGGIYYWVYDSTGYLTLPQVTAITTQAGIKSPGDILLEPNVAKTFRFTANGNLKMPGPINFQQNATIPLGAPAANGANDRVTIWDFEGGGSGYNYAIGAEGNHMWFTMDVNNGTGGFKFYSRDTLVFKIRDDGALIFSDNTVQNTAYTGGAASLPLANGTSNVDIALANGYVTVTANTFTWTFNETNGLLELAGNLANFSSCSAINFVANSSGDGAGYSTIELRPDSNASLDQYIIIDPTAPSHIHIRAGGQQDNSNADLFFGGEYSHLKVHAGANSEVSITANNHQFRFGEFGYGALKFPNLTYADLPQSPNIIAGQRAFVTDSNLAAFGNFGAVISGGGANNTPVWSDGINWFIG